MTEKEGWSRRRFLIGSGTFALALPLAGKALAEEAATPDINIETPENLFCVYVERATGRVVSAKSFIDVNPEIVNGPQALNPYIAPTRNISLGTRAPTLFKLDVKRFAIVDIEKRNETLSAFNSLHDAYTPGEFTHHFLLSLADRELGRESLGAWALSKANEAQKATALELLARIHTGYNGELITGDPEKLAEAVRFYTGRELIRPVLFLGQAPDIGAMVFIPAQGLRVASAGALHLAQAGNHAVGGGVAVGMGSNMAKAVSTASQGATSGGVSAVAAAVGASAGVGAGGGGSTSTGGSGGSSAGASSSSSSSSGGGACFVAGTEVLMADGKVKEIEDVVEGEWVRGANGQINQVLALHRPKLGNKHLYSVNGPVAFVTGDHPFMTTGGWKSIDPTTSEKLNPGLVVGALVVGDMLVTDSGEEKIVRLERATASPETQLYNFSVSNNQTFFVRFAGGGTALSTTKAAVEVEVVAAGFSGFFLVHNKGGAGGGCFISGTEVLMSDGSVSPIEDVKPGDRLLGQNGEANDVVELKRPMLGKRSLFAFNGGGFFVTDSHPFMTEDGWKSIDPAATAREHQNPLPRGEGGEHREPGEGLQTDSASCPHPNPSPRGRGASLAFDPFNIGQLKIGDVLISKDGPIPLSSIDSQDAASETPLFNFRLTGNQTYFVREKGSSTPFLLVHNK
ncbi:MAG: hypothetical protein HQL44_16645 [Alphaproteobacteria bacterium]|nr:hypothetical protein [Alphaproteobacteria bacterium]